MQRNNKTKLFISSIKLKNYRTYQGENSLDLSDDSRRTITIIHGRMGEGKTTIIDAIYWCLYGEERANKSRPVSQDEGLINKNVLQRMTVGDEDEMFVELWFYDDDGLLYTVKRKIKIEKKEESSTYRINEVAKANVPLGIDFTPSVLFKYRKLLRGDQDSNLITDDNPDVIEEHVLSVFPPELASYFLFDAELLNDFFNAKEETYVKNGIEIISGLPVIDNATKVLKKLGNSITDRISEGNSAVKPYSMRKEIVDRELAGFINERDDLEKEIKGITLEIDELNEYLRTHNEEEIRKIREKQEEAERDMQRLNGDLDKVNLQISTFLFNSIPTLLLMNTLSSAEKIFEESEDMGRIPPAIRTVTIDKILSYDPPVCICGNVLEEGSPQKKLIMDLKSKIIDSPLAEEISDGRNLLSRIRTNTVPSKLGGEYGELIETRAELNHLLKNKRLIKTSSQRQLENYNEGEVRENSLRKRDLERQRTEKYMKKGELKPLIEGGSEEQINLEKKLREEAAKEDKNTVELNKSRLTTTIRSILEQCRAELIEDFRSSAEEITTKYFLSLVSRKQDFQKVTINSNYDMLVLDSYDRSKKLSMGQSHCLALAYIAAMREITNRDYFMMIDSPLHNISQQERIDIAKNLPNYLLGTQITLLVQDQEYTGTAEKDILGDRIPSVRETLINNNSIWKEYILETHKDNPESSSRTTIKLLNDFSRST